MDDIISWCVLIIIILPNSGRKVKTNRCIIIIFDVTAMATAIAKGILYICGIGIAIAKQ